MYWLGLAIGLVRFEFGQISGPEVGEVWVWTGWGLVLRLVIFGFGHLRSSLAVGGVWVWTGGV